MTWMSTGLWYLPWHLVSTVLWYLPWHGCQQYCDVYHDMDVKGTVTFTTWMSTVLWLLPQHGCQQYRDIYHNLMCQLYEWLSTVLWRLPELDVSTLCMDVNSTVVFTTTWCVNSMHGCQQYCDIYHNLMCQLYAWMSTVLWHLPQCDVSTLCMDVNSTVTFTTWMSTVLWCLPWPGQLALW